MSVTPVQLDLAIAAARAREAQGYFAKVKAGDQKAASLFARLVAFDLNPAGHADGYGWLTKQPGETQVDGWAEDAIVLGNSPSDFDNVVDLIVGAGAPGASIGGAVKPRRAGNTWVAPHWLTADEMQYLKAGAVPGPSPSCQFPPRDQGLAFYTNLDAKYKAHGYAPTPYFVDKEGTSVWYAEYLRYRTLGKTHDEAQAIVFTEIDAVWGGH